MGVLLEAGANDIANAIDIEGGDAVSFNGVYIENTHKTVLKSRNSLGIDFSNCRFVGVDLGSGLEAFRFDAPNDLISFGSNTWFFNTTGPANMVIAGHNDKLVGTASNVYTARSERHGSLVSRRRAFANTLTFSALRFSRSANSVGNSLSGHLRVMMHGVFGGFFTTQTAEFLVTAKGIPGNDIVLESAAGTSINNNFSITLGTAAQSSISTDLQIICSGATGGANTSSVSFAFDWFADTADDALNIIARPL